MKKMLTQSLVGLGLTCLALAGPSRLVAADLFVVSTFDSDLGSNPYATNIWTDSTATSFVWTNAGNPDGSMFSVHDWPQVPPGNDYSWQEDQAHLRPWSTNGPGLDLRLYQSIDFDVLVKTDVSSTNLHGDMPYGGINVNAQGDPYWGNNPTSGAPWTYLGTAALTGATTNGGWRHYSLPTLAFQYTMSELIFQFFNWGNSNNAMHTEVLVDNIQLIPGLGLPPTMKYSRATRGLNMWSTSGVSDRNSIQTYQPGGNYYMWPGSGGASYSFTIGSYPSNPARTNLGVRMYLVPRTTTDGAPDWSQPDCIFMDLGVNDNGNAFWIFRWKTNSPNGNGQFYDPNSLIQITNPTPVGKWTLSFGSDTSVTMSAPNGNSTNFTMGVHPNVPNISGNFMEVSTNYGEVYIGLFTGATNAGDLDVVFTAAQLGGNINNISNNWQVETTLDPNSWVPVGTPPMIIVPTNNCWWVEWFLPDGGFALQTNTVGVGVSNCWSTNIGLPAAPIYANHRGLLVKPGDLPNTSKLFFRLSRPGY